MEELDLLLTNANIVNTEEIFRGVIGIRGEKISLIADSEEGFTAKKIIDLGENYVLPGVFHQQQLLRQ